MAITELTASAKATQAAQAPAPANQAKDKGFASLGTDDFIKILVAELSNQNPLDPADTSKLIDQIGSINNLQSTSKLTDTLKSLNLSQSLSSAAGLIGKTVAGSIGNTQIAGVVKRAVVENGQVFLLVDDTKLPLSNVTEIEDQPFDQAASAATDAVDDTITQ